jgi:hypothetical protein
MTAWPANFNRIGTPRAARHSLADMARFAQLNSMDRALAHPSFVDV